MLFCVLLHQVVFHLCSLVSGYAGHTDSVSMLCQCHAIIIMSFCMIAMWCYTVMSGSCSGMSCIMLWYALLCLVTACDILLNHIMLQLVTLYCSTHC